MKDKLIIIAIIQNTIKDMSDLMMQGSGQRSIEQQGVLKGMGKVLFDIHFAITGNLWQQSPKALMQWMVQYTKDQARMIEGGQEKIIITEVN